MGIEGNAATEAATNTTTSDVITNNDSNVNTNNNINDKDVNTKVENESEADKDTDSDLDDMDTKSAEIDEDEDEDEELNSSESNSEISDKKTEESQKIKVGDKEYTLDEIQKIFNEKNETKKPEHRPAQTIQQELQTLQAQNQNDYNSFKQRFVQKSMVDPDSGYTAEYLFQYGEQTGDFSYFINTLNPIDAIAFEKERQQGINKYDEIFGVYSKELQESLAFEKRTADGQAFAEYKTKRNEEFKNNPFLSHIYDNYISKKYGFSEQGLAEFMTAVQQAREFEAEQNAINTDTQDGKDRMMNSPANNGKTIPADKYSGIPRSWAAIYEKGQSYYNKNSKIIDEMDSKGLIKA